MRPLIRPITLLAVGLVAVGCEPASVTEARDQISRGPARTVQLSIPVTRTALNIADVLSDLLNVTTTTIFTDSLLAVVVSTQTLTVSTGDSTGAISGPLPLFTFDVEEVQEIPNPALNLGQFESAVRDATINAALTAITVSNSADAPLTLSDFTLGVVQLDAGGQPLRDMANNLMYELDAGGSPILVAVEDSPGAGVFTISRIATVIDTLQTSALVDRLVDLLLDGNRAAVAGAGTANVGDGTVVTILATDRLVVDVAFIIGLDLTVPVLGISFDTSIAGTGLDLDPADADETANRLDSAMAVLAVENGTPFGLEAVVAVVGGSFTGDVFQAPGHIELDTLIVAAPTVDANGRVTQSTTDTTMTGLTGTEARVFFDSSFTAGLRVRLLPPAGGRAAVRISDELVIRAGASVFLRTGGSQ